MPMATMMRRRAQAAPSSLGPGPILRGRFGFTANGAVLNLGSAPALGQWDILYANSDTVISGVGGFTSLVVALANQDAHIFGRQAVGGEGSTITVTTVGDHPGAIVWERWSSTLGAFVSGGQAQTNASLGVGTPAVATGALPASNTVLVGAALHGIGPANQTAPVWSAGLTTGDPLASIQGSLGSGCASWNAWAEDAPGAGLAVALSSWSGDGTSDRYTLYAVFS